jgi:hypothetical protein
MRLMPILQRLTVLGPFVALMCLGLPATLGSDEIIPWALFQFRAHTSSRDDEHWASVIQETFRLHMSPRIRYVPDEDIGPDQRKFIQKHGVQYYFDGDITFTDGGNRVLLRLNKVHSSEPVLERQVVTGKDLEKARDKLLAELKKMMPTLLFRLEDDGRDPVLAYCVSTFPPKPDLDILGVTITRKYATHLQEKLNENKYRVKGLGPAEIQTFCMKDEAEEFPLLAAYNHVASGFLVSEPDKQIMEVRWDDRRLDLPLETSNADEISRSMAEKISEELLQIPP